MMGERTVKTISTEQLFPLNSMSLERHYHYRVRFAEIEECGLESNLIRVLMTV
jgi:hypothetical protein